MKIAIEQTSVGLAHARPNNILGECTALWGRAWARMRWMPKRVQSGWCGAAGAGRMVRPKPREIWCGWVQLWHMLVSVTAHTLSRVWAKLKAWEPLRACSTFLHFQRSNLCMKLPHLSLNRGLFKGSCDCCPLCPSLLRCSLASLSLPVSAANLWC